MTVLLVIIITTAALLPGAVWGAYGKMPKRLEGFMVALAGGALIVSLMDELVTPAKALMPLWGVLGGVALGAVVFTVLDWVVETKVSLPGNFGLLLAVTLDGVPENLALGTALIGAEAMAVAALAGSIFLSNLPEAAGGTKRMIEDGMEEKSAVLLWGATAVLLSGAALLGYFVLPSVSDEMLGFIKCFAAGAILASLAIEVFPQAFREDHRLSGIAVACGLALAVWLGSLGGGQQ